MTFSLIGRSKDGRYLGVAVASKFLAVGAYVPAAAADAGAVATQALGNIDLKTRGLELLRNGSSAADVINAFFADDPKRTERQAGIVGKNGTAVTYTGSDCLPWAGGRADMHAAGSYAAQGNMLAGPQVIDTMVDAWIASAAEQSLALRLVRALQAGQEAGGDPRGKQAAAVLVVSEGGGYGGNGDVVVDLRADDDPEPIAKLLHMLELHELYFGETPEEQLLVWDDSLQQEITDLLKKLGYDGKDIKRDLYQWMGRENFEERWHDTKVDPVVLEQLRKGSR
jgi:uncharacterized Ntn-hydrolase superfamily protein